MNNNIIGISMNDQILEYLDQITSIFNCTRSAFIRFIISEYRSYLNHENVDTEVVDYVNELRYKLGEDTNETE